MHTQIISVMDGKAASGKVAFKIVSHKCLCNIYRSLPDMLCYMVLCFMSSEIMKLKVTPFSVIYKIDTEFEVHDYRPSDSMHS